MCTRVLDPCVYCGAPAASWDHVVPRCRVRGLATKNNKVRACIECNQSKGCKDLDEWLAERGTPDLVIPRPTIKGRISRERVYGSLRRSPALPSYKATPMVHGGVLFQQLAEMLAAQ